jgi:hypothetical protein
VKKGIKDPYACQSKHHKSFTYQEAPFSGAVVEEESSLLRFNLSLILLITNI